MKSAARMIVGGLAIAWLAACAPEVRTHGYVPIPEKIAQLEVGRDTRGSVQRKIGRPAADSPFDAQQWFYVSSIFEHMTYHKPEVVDRTVLALTFDENDVLVGLDEYGMDDGRQFALVSETTPTYGRQLTIIEQLIGNLGSVRADNVLGSGN